MIYSNHICRVAQVLGKSVNCPACNAEASEHTATDEEMCVARFAALIARTGKVYAHPRTIEQLRTQLPQSVLNDWKIARVLLVGNYYLRRGEFVAFDPSALPQPNFKITIPWRAIPSRQVNEIAVLETAAV